MKSLVSLLLLLGLTVACDKEAPASIRGLETSPSAIKAAQDRSIAQLDPYTVKQGQKVHFVETQEVISSQGPIKLLSKEWVTEVTKVENGPEERYLTTYKSVNDKLWDKDFVYVFKSVYFLPQISRLQLLDQFDENRYALTSVVHQLKERSGVEETEIVGVAFHNLKEEKVVIVPPNLVKSTDNCKGIVDCRLNGDRISYDVVFLLSDNSTQSHNVEWIISPEVPFFAALLKQCATSIVPIDNARVLVKQCNEVVDFDY